MVGARLLIVTFNVLLDPVQAELRAHTLFLRGVDLDDAVEPRAPMLPPASLEIIKRRRTLEGIDGRPSFKSLVDDALEGAMAWLQRQLQGLADSLVEGRSGHQKAAVDDVITYKPCSDELENGKVVGIKYAWGWEGGKPIAWL